MQLTLSLQAKFCSISGAPQPHSIVWVVLHWEVSVSLFVMGGIIAALHLLGPQRPCRIFIQHGGLGGEWRKWSDLFFLHSFLCVYWNFPTVICNNHTPQGTRELGQEDFSLCGPGGALELTGSRKSSIAFQILFGARRGLLNKYIK